MGTGVEIKQSVECADEALRELRNHHNDDDLVKRVLRAGVDIAFEEFWWVLNERVRFIQSSHL